MQSNKMFFGKGDFQKLIKVLSEQKNDQFKDVGRKLLAIKQGYLFKKGLQPDVTEDIKE